MTKEEAIECLKLLRIMDAPKLEEAVNMAIEALEEQRTGKWTGGELGYCSVCGHEGCASDIWDRCTYTYCPNCGSRLEVEE